MRVSPRLFFAGSAACAVLLSPLLADAQQRTAEVANQQRPVELAIASTLKASTNGNEAASGFEQRDLFLTVRPSVSLALSGARLRLNGEVGADFLVSKNKTQDNQILPFARVGSRATLAERLLFLDAALDVHQVEQDRFAGRVEQGLGSTSETASTLVLSPSLSHELDRDASISARADFVWAKFSQTSTSDSRDERVSLRYDVKPRPLGGAVEVRGQNVRYDEVAANNWNSQAASVGPRYSINDEVVVGLVGGVERTSVPGSSQTDPLVGVNLLWAPSQRSQLATSVDDRFFGTGWNVALRHRTPTFSFSMRATRAPVLAGNDGAGSRSSLPAFLDSILTTRYPDPAERAAIVSSLVATRGLQSTIQGAAGASANYAQLGQGADAGIVFLGIRNTLSVSVYHSSLTQLARADTGMLFPGSGLDDNRQAGATLQMNRKITPIGAIDLSLNYSRVEGFNASTGDLTREGNARLAYVHQLAPRTTASMGATYRKVATNVAGETSFDEATLFVGMAHRF